MSLHWTPGRQAVHLSAHESLYHHTQTEHAMTCMQKQRRSNRDQVRQTGEYIKVCKNQLLESVRGPQPDLALQSFYGDILFLCSQPGASIDPSHLNAIIGATAKSWTPACARLGQQEQQQARHEVHAFLTKMMQRLQPLLPDVGAREAANLLWSSAKLGLNPDALVPGMTDSLARHFMGDMDAATGQGFANVLVACAQLQLSPCQGGLFKAILNRLVTADLSKFDPQNVANTLHSLVTIPAVAPSVEVLDALCQRLGVQLKSRQVTELPDAQSIANTMWALSKLKHAPSDELAMSMVGRMVALCRVPGQQPTAQAISNVLLAFAQLRLPVKQADTDNLASFFLSSKRRWINVLDALCQRFGVLLNSRPAAELPVAQSIANTLWALSKLKHAPSDQLAMSMVGRMVALCCVPGQQPTPQAISNVLLACAELSVPVKQADTDSLASFLLSSNKRQGTQQAYANTAWSLAVIGHLRQAQFMLLLDQMFALSGSPGEMSTPPLLTAAQLTQLYQAQDWLQPHPTAPAQQLHRLGPRPAPDKPPFFGIHKLCAALNQLQLSFKAMGGQHHMHHAMGGEILSSDAGCTT